MRIVKNYYLVILFSLLNNTILLSQDARPLMFEKAFSGDTLLALDPDVQYMFQVYSIGKIKIETGKIISCDVLEMHNGIPIAEVFPKGNFLVQVAVAADIENSVMYSRILFSSHPVKIWKLVSSPGVKQDPVSDSGYNGCVYKDGIGVAIFIDSLASKVFNQKPHNVWGNFFINTIKNKNSFGAVYGFNGHSLAAFPGNLHVCYGVYIGYDENGKICRLLANLGRIALPYYR